MLNEQDAIKHEVVKYKTSTSHVFYFYCSDCKINTLKCERKNLKKSTGLCRFCAHKGIPFRSAYNHLKDNIKRTNKKRKKQKVFDLSFEDFLQFTNINNCHYCNGPIFWIKHTGTGNHRYNLDRMDSSKGYSKDNVVVCCKECNIVKGAYFSYEEFKAVISLIKELRPDGVHPYYSNPTTKETT
jgi:hypothetical protein